MKQWYLFHTRHVQDALFQTPGLAPKERRRAAFWWRKWLNAMAPTNFLATNPVAQRKAVETRGESLRRGFEIFMDDVQARTVRMTEPERLPRRHERSRPRRRGGVAQPPAGADPLRADRAQVRPTPIVIVTPWINKFYVLDLEPKKSLVQLPARPGLRRLHHQLEESRRGHARHQLRRLPHRRRGRGGARGARTSAARTRCTPSGTASAARCSRCTWPGSTAATRAPTCPLRTGRCSPRWSISSPRATSRCSSTRAACAGLRTPCARAASSTAPKWRSPSGCCAPTA